MLGEVCDYVHNYFDYEMFTGTFVIEGGTIPLTLLDGQRFRIRGSALNDGIYTWHAAGIKNDDDDTASPLQAESFTGSITTMEVPKTFEGIASEIAAWVQANAAALASPYTSESFGGYSYVKAGGATGRGNVKTSLTWRDVFGHRLNAYRKIS